MFLYWHRVLELQLTVLLVVRVFREGNLMLLVSSPKETVCLCFSLKSSHVRGFSVLIRHLKTLKEDDLLVTTTSTRANE